MTRPTRCTRTGSRSPLGEPLSRPARATRTAPRRLLSSLVLAVAVVAGVLAAGSTTPVEAAGWNMTTSRASGTLSMASLTDSTWSLVSGSGTVATSTFKLSGLLTGTVTGYVDLVNNASVPATLTFTISMGSLVAVTPAMVCSQAWNTTTGACAGTPTTVATTLVAGVANGTYSTPGMVAVGGHVFAKVTISGVAATVTLTRGTVTPRAGMDRTSA